ncbi:3263_t:CDS:2 [Ambispora gerdemannii]|uniref:3263_t:CDS:1 n=1 Tax=Ambispora gerdemannii TaxID=144530 RepID=A0A9N8VGP4_9GLOM|nr:3263_t:CDS:2 [Ambispora gerdemannii]
MTSSTTPSSSSFSDNINAVVTNNAPANSKSKKEWLDYALNEKLIKSVPYSEIQDIDVIGRGGFAEVYVGFWPSASSLVALKCLKVQPGFDNPKSWDLFVGELRLVMSVNHNESIIRFFGVSRAQTFHTVSENHYEVSASNVNQIYETPDLMSGFLQLQNMKTICKEICFKYKQALKRATIPSECSPVYHCALGDTAGLKWHLNNANCTDAGRHLIATTAQYCPPSQIIPIFETLLEFNVEMKSQLDEKNHTAFHWLSENIRLLEKSNSSDNEKNYFSDATQWLINKGLDINAKNIFGRTALSWLVEKQQPQAVKIMLQYEVNPNIADENGSTPLHRVLTYEYKVNNERFNRKNREVVILLLEKGAHAHIPINPSQPSSTRSFPNSLFLAIFRGWPNEILQLLIKHEANPLDLKDGQDALHYAISMKRTQAVHFLVENVEEFRSANISEIKNNLRKLRHNSTRSESIPYTIN